MSSKHSVADEYGDGHQYAWLDSMSIQDLLMELPMAHHCRLLLVQ